MTYNDLAAELKDAPMTWYPALITIAIEAAIAKGVFMPGGVASFVKRIEQLAPVPPMNQERTARLTLLSSSADTPATQEIQTHSQILSENAAIGERWRQNSSLEEWFPLTAERLALLEARVKACGESAAIIVKQNQEIERLKEIVCRCNADWCRLKDWVIAGNGPEEMFRWQEACKDSKGVEIFIGYVTRLWDELAKRKSLNQFPRDLGAVPPLEPSGQDEKMPTAGAGEAGDCTFCGGKVYHRAGKPGEFDHECA